MKKLIFGGICVLLVGVVILFGRPAYRNWKHERLLTQTREFLAKNDLRDALLSARQALTLKPGNVESARFMAIITEKLRAPAAVSWRQRVVELEPQVVDNRLDLARTALLMGDFTKADAALGAVPATNRNTATYHQLAAMVAVSENNIAQADWHFGEATKLAPENKGLQLDQAIIHLQAKNQDMVEAAIKTLQSLSDDPEFRKDALRHLAMNAVRNKDFPQAEEFARQLQTSDQSTFEDRVLYLSVLNESKSPDFAANLASVKAECEKQPGYIPIVASWLCAHQKTEGAIDWLNSLPESVKGEAPFRAALSDAYAAHEDWFKLQTYLENQDWGEHEFIRHAQLAHAARKLKQDLVAEDHWNAAVRAASDRARALAVLASLAATWGMEAERESLLWTIADRYPGERWALQALSAYYLANRDTAGLQRVFNSLVSHYPDDLGAKNNLASTLLLLNTQLDKANEYAQEVYEKSPKTAAFATTYAYSLHLHGRTADGLKILRALPPKDLQTPGIAVYYAVLLYADGENAEAGKYFAIAATDKNLLPEEQALIQSGH